ncbi:cyclin family protein [Paraburkholderia sp. CI3]|uniref:cyclin family protein n=1 Tax=Paraburkholderia sp. CI3 TaxID=2991060 RepID=UPI003D262278
MAEIERIENAAERGAGRYSGRSAYENEGMQPAIEAGGASVEESPEEAPPRRATKVVMPSGATVEDRSHVVTHLVKTVVARIQEIWPSKRPHPAEAAGAIPKQTRSTLNEMVVKLAGRSRTSKSVLILALHYLEKIEPYAKAARDRAVAREPLPTDPATLDGRRMFLASLMLAHKYLNEPTYTNEAWSRISGLDLGQLGPLEIHTLKMLEYELGMTQQEFSDFERKIMALHE